MLDFVGGHGQGARRVEHVRSEDTQEEKKKQETHDDDDCRALERSGEKAYDARCLNRCIALRARYL